jgi:multiple sugar transport system permease protein
VIQRLGRATVLAGAAAVALLPMYWLVITALKPRDEIFGFPPTFMPRDPTLRNFETLFDASFFGSYLRNSIIVVGCSVAVALLLGSLAAYSLARNRLFGGRNEQVSFAILVARMIPPVVLLVPVFLIVLQLRGVNSYAGLIPVYAALNLPFVIWMMRGFIEDIPPDLEEAAMADGASRLHALRTILFPLLAPGLIATSIFAVIVTYNEFIFALILTSTPDAQTFPVGASTFLGKSVQDLGALAAAGVLGLLPVLAFALLVQRHLVRGLTLGSFK